MGDRPASAATGIQHDHEGVSDQYHRKRHTITRLGRDRPLWRWSRLLAGPGIGRDRMYLGS